MNQMAFPYSKASFKGTFVQSCSNCISYPTRQQNNSKIPWNMMTASMIEAMQFGLSKKGFFGPFALGG